MGKTFNIFLAAFAATGSFLFGYDSGVMTDVIASQNFLAFFNTKSKSPVVGAINATFSGGAVLGSLMGAFTIDRFGRRRTVQIGALIASVGALLQCAAYNLGMMLVGRIIAGWAVGLLSMSVPVYQAECAHPNIRGLIVGLTQQMIGVGFIVSSWIGYGCNHAPNRSSVQWRFPLAFQILPSLVLLVGLIWMPESPRHLLEKGQDEEALKVLRRLHANSSDELLIQAEFTEIKSTIAKEGEVTAESWLSIFKVPEWRTRLMHGTLIQVFTQLTGASKLRIDRSAGSRALTNQDVINYYQTIMYEALGFTGQRGVLVAGLYNIVGPVTNFFFIVFILDRVGRRKPLLFGAIGITVTLISEAVLNAVNPDGSKRGLSIAGVFFIFLFSVIFSLSFGPISWVYMAEIMPLSIRGRGNAFAAGIGNWLVATIFAQVSPIALARITWKYYFVFVTFNLCVTIPTIALIFKETKQLSLEEIDLLFGQEGGRTVDQEIVERERVRRRSTIVVNEDVQQQTMITLHEKADEIKNENIRSLKYAA
ncbi:MAG: hypothetical protein M1820_005576 [Bogoriella megaspora]|nr:MAG: hypothetical protein M1820_005576 [Bogoriella megaspora]